MLSVSLLGRLRVCLDGKEIRFAGRPKVAPLLAYVLLNARDALPRDRVAFDLWPDEVEAAARGNLRRHLHYLREALPPASLPWILTDAKNVRWNPSAPVEVDVTDFERRIGVVEDRHIALSLYAPMLPGIDDEWVVDARERLRRKYISLLSELAIEARGRREFAAATEYLERILEDDPWREDAVRALMTVRCDAGDRASALQLCTNFEDRLRSEMQAKPMSETVALRRAIERGERLANSSPLQNGKSRTDATPELPFHGRDRELQRLREAWDAAVGGEGEAVLILGEAGFGKTRLCTEFALFAESRGGNVFWGTSSLPKSGTYQVVAQTLRAARDLIDWGAFDRSDRALLARLVPEFAEREDVDAGLEEQRARLFDAVGRVYAALARQRPAVIICEDLHAAGPATTAMLVHLVAHCRVPGVLLLLTARDENGGNAGAVSKLRRGIEGKRPKTIALGRLSDSAVGAIADGAAALAHADSSVMRRIAEPSRGHPLFLAELLRAAVEGGGTQRVPARLRDAIAHRIALLSNEARFLLKVSSVVGGAFDLDLVGEVVGWGEGDFAAAADELIERRFIRESAHRARFDFEFTHDLISAVAYDALAAPERRRWHRRTALVSETHFAESLDELAFFVARHFELGEQHDSAATYYLKAGQLAEASFATDDALAYARQGLALRPSDDTVRFDLLALEEHLHGLRSDRMSQRATLRRMEPIARRIGDANRSRELLRRRETLQRFLGQWRSARSTLQRLNRLAVGDARWEAIAKRDLAVLQINQGEHAAARSTIALAVQSAAACSDAAIAVSTLALEAQILATLGRRDEAENAVARAKGVAMRAHSPRLAMDVAHCETSVYTLFRAWHNVVRAGSTLFRLARRSGNRNQMAAAHLMIGGAHVKLFRIDSARKHLRLAIETYGGTNALGAFIAHNNLATLELDIGRFDRAEEMQRIIRAELTRTESALGRKSVALIGCDLALRTEQYESAIEQADALLARLARTPDPLFEAEALACKGAALLACGNVAEARGVLESARSKETAFQTDAGTRVAAELALVYAIAGDERAGEVATERISPSGPGEPYVLWTVARALHYAGRESEANDALQRAYTSLCARAAQLKSSGDRVAFESVPAYAALSRAALDQAWPNVPATAGRATAR